MDVPLEAVLLRIFIGEEDRFRGHALYEALVEAARRQAMAGATVLYAPEGYGRSRRVRSERNVDSGARLPMVVEIVDAPEQIDRFLPVLNEMVESGLVTMEKVRTIRYRPHAAPEGS